MNTQPNLKLIIIGVVIGITIVSAVFWKNIFPNDDYATVSLSTGTLMFGKISRFPNFTLTHPFIAVKDKDDRDQLVPLDMAPWAPKDGVLYLNDAMVVHWSYLDPASQLVQQMKSPQQSQPQIPSSANAPTQTSPK